MNFIHPLFLLLALSLHTIVSAGLPADTIYLTWQRNPDTTMTIQWLSLADNNHPDEIEYRIKGKDAWQYATGVHFPLPRSKQYLFHRVELVNLKPDTLYQFRMSEEDQPLYFRTMPQDLKQPIRFVVGGDMYHEVHSSQSMQQTCRQATTVDPHFALVGGDIAYAVMGIKSTENIERWVEWVRLWSRCMVTQEGRLIPVIAAIGNHDLEGHYDQSPQEAAVFSTLFPMPGKQIYNTLDFGSYLTLFILDSGHANSIQGAQLQWLKSALKTHSASLYRFAIYHVPAYPCIRAFKNTHSVAIRRHWVPLFENAGIQTVFEHHDHAYKRTFPLLKDKSHPNGVVYIGDGAWGVDKPRRSYKKRGYLAHYASARHFILVTLDQEKQTLVSINDKGQKIDEWTRYLK